MPDLVSVRRALISVSDKRDVVPFARALAELGVELVSTGGTAKMLSEAGLDVISIEEVTGFPEMMDGRVKTLHPAVHGALLGRRDKKAHLEAMQTHGITPIDLVCVNLYPFHRTLNENLSEGEAIELIDIGGPSMLRSAAKNHAYVTVVTSPDQYDRVINELRGNECATRLEMRRDLAAAAFSRTAEYDATISAWMCDRHDAAFPPQLRISMTRADQLRYGENPHQSAAVYANPADAAPNVIMARLLHGKSLSYNNLNDGASAFEIVRELGEAFRKRAGAVVVKHTNPCGMALADTAADAFARAHGGDPVAAFGGILAFNVEVDGGAADVICEGQKFFEVIVAPSFTEDAIEQLSKRWTNVRLLTTGPLDSGAIPSTLEMRTLPGGMLMQQRDQALPEPKRWQHVAGPTLDEASLTTASFVWLASKHLKSNAVAIGAQDRLLGAGAGQMDRVTACRLATEKAGDVIRDYRTPIASSDGFFPFADGPEVLIDAGVRAIIQPGGSKRDAETVDLCRRRDVSLYLTGIRHFKH